MAGIAVQFGAGNIGRGFLGQLLHESGFEVVFVDVQARIVDALNARHAYEIDIVGPGATTIPIQNVRALHGQETAQVAHAIASAEIVCTAVGAHVLHHLAPAIAEGLRLRRARSGKPLNLLLCENLPHAAETLRHHVAAYLSGVEAEAILPQTGFVQAVVSRMVPLQTPPTEDPLRLRTEAYKRLPIDASAVVGQLPTIACVDPVPDFRAHVERKLFSHNCGHAVLGYWGHKNGYTYGYEALCDSRVNAVLKATLEETSAALITKHGFEPQEQAAHVTDLLQRFENPALGDTCLRLARDPIRKLAPNDRLVGAARCCELQNVTPRTLACAISVALQFNDPSDPIAQELQAMRREIGDAQTLRRISDIAPDEPLAALIAATYDIE